MMTEFYEVRELLEEIEELERELEYMSDAWDGDDPCEAAASDPGLQYEKEEEIESKIEELKSLFRQILEEK